VSEGHISKPPTRKTLFVILGGGLVAAVLILVSAILPAEYHIDPLGIGSATGLLKLSRPKEVTVALPATAESNAVAHFYPIEFRTDAVDIPLAASGDEDRHDELEWKVRMKTGDTLVYSWSVKAPPEEFYFDFHGQSDPNPDVNVLSYQEGVGIASNGSMTAQFDGIHGWFLQNQSEKPVVVHLKLSGFYEMRPDPYAPE
jgi:hypothetical protein